MVQRGIRIGFCEQCRKRDELSEMIIGRNRVVAFCGECLDDAVSRRNKSREARKREGDSPPRETP